MDEGASTRRSSKPILTMATACQVGIIDIIATILTSQSPYRRDALRPPITRMSDFRALTARSCSVSTYSESGGFAMYRARNHASRLCFFLLPALTLTMLAGTASAGEGFYVMMMAYQTIPNESRYSHTFGTYVHATWPGQEPEPGTVHLETRTISWLPETTNLRPLALHPECGRNFGLEETIRVAQGFGARVTLWGPYRIEPELYERRLRTRRGIGKRSGTLQNV